MDQDNYFLRMSLNNAWANSTLYGAIIGLGEDGFWETRPGFFGSIGRTMNHIYEVDLFYVDALTEGGKGRAVYSREDIRDPSSLGKLQSEVDMAFASFCGSVSEQNCADQVLTERKDGKVPERIDRTILHLVQHQIHHRGQVHGMLSHAGATPPQLDDFYLNFGRDASAALYWN